MVIDAGHGGFDRGGIPGQRVPEKTMALDVAQRLAKNDYAGRLPRRHDARQRCFRHARRTCRAIANRYRDAVFICIHFNSATRAGANGIETYYYSNNSAALAANIHRQVVGRNES